MAFTHVADSGGFVSSGSTYTPTAGNLLVLAIVDTGNSTQPSYTVASGWVHVAAADALVSTSPFANSQIWYYPNVPAGTLTVTFTGGGAPQGCLLYTSPSPRDRTRSRMPSSA